MGVSKALGSQGIVYNTPISSKVIGPRNPCHGREHEGHHETTWEGIWVPVAIIPIVGGREGEERGRAREKWMIPWATLDPEFGLGTHRILGRNF